MKSNNLPLFIALRIGREAHSRAERIMVRVATISTAICVATMIITVCVVLGFQSQISDKVVGFASHFNIVSLGSGAHPPIEENAPYRSELLKLPYIKGVDPYIEVGGVVKSDSSVMGILYKGVEQGYNLSFFEQNLVAGSLPHLVEGQRSKEVLISQQMANRLMVDVGDKLHVMFLQDGIFNDRITISGIYSTAMVEFDSKVIIGHIANLRRVLGSENIGKVSGFEVRVDNLSGVDSYVDEIEMVVFDNTPSTEALMVEVVTQKYMQIFDWLELQNINIAVVIAIMMIVAGFNMISMMLIVLIDKSSMIGTFKSIGMDNGTIQKIFLYRSAYILSVGIGWGVALSLGLALLQHHFKLLTLPADGYFLNYVPIEINFLYICAIALGSFVSILLFELIPVKIISSISPSKSIKFS